MFVRKIKGRRNIRPFIYYLLFFSPFCNRIILNITAPELLELIKSSVEFDGDDINITMDNLIGLNHGVTPDDLVNTLLELKNVSMHDKGFIIPKNYFE